MTAPRPPHLPAPPSPAKAGDTDERVVPETILAVDHDHWAIECYHANHGAEHLICGEVDPSLLRSVDLVLGGPPCQPYSTAGKQRGHEDERDGIPAFCACVEAWRPRVFVMEQVASFATQAKFEGSRRTMLARMEDAGYRVQWRVLDAYQFGVPQFRRRAWFIGARADLGLPAFEWPEQTHEDPARIGLLPFELWATCGEALGLTLGPGGRLPGASGWSGQRIVDGDRPAPSVTGDGNNPEFIRIIGGGTNPRSAYADERTERDITDEPSTTIAVAAGNRIPKIVRYRWSDEMRAKHPPADQSQPSPTVMAKWAKGAAEGLLDCGGEMVRRLTPDECARLQSVPDDWVWPELDGKPMPKTARYRVIGNGWACGMAKRIGEAVRAMDPAIETVADLFCGGGLGAVGFAGRCWEQDPC